MNKMRERPGFDRRMSREEINQCPVRAYQGPVHLVRTRDELERAVELLLGEKILGFDTETRPAYRRGQCFPPALIQLAARDAVFIFQLRRLRLPKSLRKILAAPEVIKAGVAIARDIKELQAMAHFEPAGIEDIAALGRKGGLKNYGLRGMAAAVLGFRVAKGARQSNWGYENLTPAQIRYAATDAWVSRELYLAIKKWNGNGQGQFTVDGLRKTLF